MAVVGKNRPRSLLDAKHHKRLIQSKRLAKTSCTSTFLDESHTSLFQDESLTVFEFPSYGQRDKIILLDLC